MSSNDNEFQKQKGKRAMLDKKYDHKKIETGKYETWLQQDYFHSGDVTKKPFCIVIPPPNVTGKLHLGHAWNTTLQDILIRYKRMQGYDALWLPGMDHAGIATQAKVDKKLKEKGYNPRALSREEWLQHAWEWKEEYAKNIHEQWKKLGLSLDYHKERFTLDEGLNKAVNHVFVTLYKKGLIYRGERIINWDPEAMTALSNEEVIYKEIPAAFYHLKYYLEDKSAYLDVATTRPETLFGDTAIAVNPKDERYQAYIGKNVRLPLVNKLIPVIADEHADPTFQSGVVKITPAHDPNDFEVGLRHHLPRINILNIDATLNENVPSDYVGLDRYIAREKVIEDLKKQDLLISTEYMVHSVGHSERTNTVIEPYLSKQWFVKMRPLADAVLANQKKEDTKVHFVPERYEKTMLHWMEITYDWCISRQLWWGHQIPAWYRGEEVYVGETAPEGEGWQRDQDVLDTWFSSALWPFSTLGWPEETADFKRYYPNDVLVTGYDIIPFWVNRMTFQGLEFTGKRPFKDCIIHGLIRDKEGRKMSKSLGNGVDPMDVIDTYGADSLRYFLTTNTAPGMDLRYDEEKVKSTWNFINKLWNAARFVLLKLENFTDFAIQKEKMTLADQWIYQKRNELVKEVTKNMDRYDFHTVGNDLYQFIWTDFCDSYIELTKGDISNTTKSLLLEVLTTIIKLLHPFMPYVTEEIYQMLPIKDATSIMISAYPMEKDFENTAASIKMEKVLEDIREIRNLKAINKISKDAKVSLKAEKELLDIYRSQLKITDTISATEDMSLYQELSYESNYIKITYYLQNKIDYKALQEEATKLEQSIKRRENLLANQNYVNKAPQHIVSQDRHKLMEEQEKLANIRNQLTELK